MIKNLKNDEISYVYGGTTLEDLSSVAKSSALLTAKKLSMVY